MSPVKTIFCNGIANTYADANASALTISQILGRQVECCYNNGLHDVWLGSTAALAGTGLSLLANQPIPLLFLSSHRQSAVEQRKTACALLMANNIRAHLEQNPDHRIFLILHSQGRDIGNEALRALSLQERQRIKVLTLGSSPIAKKAAAQVINLQQKGDPVPRLMHLRDRLSQLVHLKFFPAKRERHLISGTGHSLESYLNHPTVKHHLLAV